MSPRTDEELVESVARYHDEAAIQRGISHEELVEFG
jgi:hypothetical protein